MAGLSHRLAAVWFADVVGYSRLMSENEGDAVAAVRLLQVVCREIVPASGGRVIKFLGDGALAEFKSTDSAVRAAIGLRGPDGSGHPGDLGADARRRVRQGLRRDSREAGGRCPPERTFSTAF